MQEREEADDSGEPQGKDYPLGRDGTWENSPRPAGTEGEESPSPRKRFRSQKPRRGSHFPRRWDSGEQ